MKFSGNCLIFRQHLNVSKSFFFVTRFGCKTIQLTSVFSGFYPRFELNLEVRIESEVRIDLTLSFDYISPFSRQALHVVIISALLLCFYFGQSDLLQIINSYADCIFRFWSLASLYVWPCIFCVTVFVGRKSP